MDIDEVNESSFILNSTNKAFSDRQKQIFDQLNVLESSTVQTLSKNKYVDDPFTDQKNESLVNTNRNKRKFNEIKQFRGKESIFKRPEAPISKCLQPRRPPDFKINPHKWTKYSLEDVTPDAMSNRVNTSAALSFLRELEERKQNNTDKIEIDTNIDNNIVFKKREKVSFNNSAIIKSKQITDGSNNEKPLFKSTTLVMPEYVVGQRKKKERKIRHENKEKRSELKLDHLLEDDFDDN